MVRPLTGVRQLSLLQGFPPHTTAIAFMRSFHAFVGRKTGVGTYTLSRREDSMTSSRCWWRWLSFRFTVARHQRPRFWLPCRRFKRTWASQLNFRTGGLPPQRLPEVRLWQGCELSSSRQQRAGGDMAKWSCTSQIRLAWRGRVIRVGTIAEKRVERFPV